MTDQEQVVSNIRERLQETEKMLANLHEDQQKFPYLDSVKLEIRSIKKMAMRLNKELVAAVNAINTGPDGVVERCVVEISRTLRLGQCKHGLPKEVWTDEGSYQALCDACVEEAVREVMTKYLEEREPVRYIN